MRSNKFTMKQFGRSAMAVAVGMCFASIAYAQSAEGSIFGRVAAKSQVTVVNLENGSTRNIQAENDGGFSFSKMQPGRYKVTSAGVTREVTVAIGSGTEVKFEEVATVTVSGSRTRSAIDVSSSESNTVFSLAEIQNLPVGRNATSVALLAPGTVGGDTELGDKPLASFGGASVAENGYYINGFDVTNIRNFLSYANLPFDAIEQQQVKTGGYGAEYGRSLGGVIALTTKRGTNKWKGGASVYWEPQNLRAKGKNVKDLEPTHSQDEDGNFLFQNYTKFDRERKESNLSYNVYAGGPIIKDKLFIFGLIEGKKDEITTYEQSKTTTSTSDKPNGMVKIDWLITDDQRLEFTGIANKQHIGLKDYSNPAGKEFSTQAIGTAKISNRASGGDVMMLKYTGYLTDNLTLSGQIGRVNDLNTKQTGAREEGQDCPVVYSPNFTPLGCWSYVWPGSKIKDMKAPDDTDKRKSARLDLEYTLNAHTIRAGYDAQKFDSAEAGGLDYNGAYHSYRISEDGSVNGVPGVVAPGGKFVRTRIGGQTSGVYSVDNTAFYIEDTWKAARNITLSGGLRAESFNNKNSDGVSFVKADNLLAPRLGGVWDMNGDASLKIFANLGRYYIPVASNTNIRATRLENSVQRFYTYTGTDPRTAAPTGLGPEIGDAQITGGSRLPNPGTVADTQLKPMSQDEIILGFQKAITKDLSFGVKFVHRTVNNGMDDFCGHAEIAKWAADKGHTDFDYESLAPCVLVNPGNDLHLKVDLKNDGVLVNSVIPASYLGLAKYKRTYNALELSAERPFDGKWGLQGSYTYAKSTGTAEGYVQSNLNQEDAGVTQDFDFGSFTHGSDGYLPNDRRHVLKLFGNYGINDNFRVGMNMVVASGRPTSCIGFVPTSVSDFNGPGGDTENGSGAYTNASSYYCLNDKGVSTLMQRGSGPRTPWTTSLDLSAAYIYKIDSGNKITFQADLFNAFNSQKVTEFNETRDFSRDTSLISPGQFNLNFRQPTSFQSARAIRFTARYEF